MMHHQRGRWDAAAEESNAPPERLLSTARRLYRTMGRTTTMTDDTMRVFAEFGLTRDHLSTGRSSGGGGGDSGPSGGPLDRNLRFLERQISRCLNSQKPIWSDTNETREFLDAVDTLIGTIHGLDPMVPGDRRILDFAEDILDKSMSRLADEFKYLMELGNAGGGPMGPFSGSLAPYDEAGYGEDEQIPVAQPVTDYNVVIDALPWGTISDLKEIARRMVEAKYSKECADVYILARRDFLEESLARMGLLRWTASEVHSAPWKDLEGEIKMWVQGSKVAFLILFPSEQRVCSRVLRDVGPAIADLVFSEVCRVAVNQLLGFADSVASSSRSPERLFSIIDLYETLRDLLPEVDAVFSDQYSAFVAEEAWMVLAKLGDAIRGIFTELENLIRRDPSNSPIPGAGVHNITRYVMNYLRVAASSWKTLEAVMDEERGGVSVSPSGDRIRPNSSLSMRVGWIMNMLLTNLDAKAAAYRDTAKTSFFLLNNGRYVVKKVSDELVEILGENWVRGQVARVRQWQAAYHKQTWGRLVDLVRLDDVGYGMSADVAAALKDKATKFGAQLDAVCEAQMEWSVVDEELRDELIRAALDAVAPAYMTFLARFRGGGREVMRQMDRSVRYGEADVQRKIRELYQGPARGA